MHRQCWYSPLLHSIFKPSGYFNFYWNPWILKEEILKCEFLHQPYARALTSEFRLIYMKCYNCNRRLVTCALTFFLMIFFRNSGKPLLKFSLTNSSLSTSWSFLNPSAQKKRELIFKIWCFLPHFKPLNIPSCLSPFPTSRDISQEVSPIHLKGVANKISSKLLLKPCFRWVVNVATVSTYGPYTSRSVVHYFS